MKRIWILASLLTLAKISAFADGVTDFVIDPVAGYTIDAPGSYRLTADVIMTANNLAISTTVNDVTLDLGGHHIAGAPGNNSAGIDFSAGTNCQILNGTVSDFGSSGISASTNSTIRNCTVRGNNKLGSAAAIFLGSQSTVESCTITGNTPTSTGSMTGIDCGSSCRIVGNAITNNQSPNSQVLGMIVGNGSLVERNILDNLLATSGNSTVTGISANQRCTIRNNSVSNVNHAATGSCFGISAGAGTLVEGNTCNNIQTLNGVSGIGISVVESTVLNNDCFGNGSLDPGNGAGIGISAGIGTLVRGNRCSSNSGAGSGLSIGIRVNGIGCRIENNHLRSNAGAAGSWGIRVQSASTFVSGNSTQGHTTGGLIFTVGVNNRVESNRMRETTGIDTVTASSLTPSSVGAGDLANVIF